MKDLRLNLLCFAPKSIGDNIVLTASLHTLVDADSQEDHIRRAKAASIECHDEMKKRWNTPESMYKVGEVIANIASGEQIGICFIIEMSVNATMRRIIRAHRRAVKRFGAGTKSRRISSVKIVIKIISMTQRWHLYGAKRESEQLRKDIEQGARRGRVLIRAFELLHGKILRGHYQRILKAHSTYLGCRQMVIDEPTKWADGKV